MKTAFITGITGQDGSYLAEFLLEKKYKVVGLVSKKHNIGYQNINSLKNKLILEFGDLLDKNSLARIIKKYSPDEIYNLGGITFVPKSWQEPELTFNVNALGVARLLELIRDFCPQGRFYQATSAKMFVQDTPYAVSKAAAHFLTQNFRSHFNLFACSGILYNHESERRGPEFVTRKISLGAAKIKLGQQKELKLGNIKARQDWGYAPDYVEAMWLMLQQKKADDYVIATGKLHSVEDACQIAFASLGLDWRKYVKYDKSLMRKEESQKFSRDLNKAKKVLGWQPKVSFKEMIEKMVENDLRLLKCSRP